MKRTGYKKLILIWIICPSFFVTLNSKAQNENVQPKFKQVIVYIPKKKVLRIPKKSLTQETDSLKNVIHEYDSSYQQQLFQGRIKDSIIDQVNQKINKQQSAFTAVQLEVSNYQLLNSQIEKNNFILFVFNSIVCILLLLMLIRYILKMRKRKRSTPQNRNIISSEKISQTIVGSNQNTIGHNLEQLEKLGRLRNAGILTEEEFIFQKQLILENSK